MNHKAEKIIRDWIKEVTSKGTWKNPHDLHIDIVDKSCKKKPEKWIEISLESFMEAIAICDELKLDFFVLLAIRLRANKKRGFSNINTIYDLKDGEKLSWTPPSLYLLKTGSDLAYQFLHSDENKKDYVKELFLKDGFQYYLAEYFDKLDKEYVKTLYILQNRPVKNSVK